MTLKYNHVAGVYTDRLTSAGQLIPLCIGSLSIIKVLLDWRTAKFARKRPRRESWQGACEQCRHDDLLRSSSISRPVAFKDSRGDRRSRDPGYLHRALLAAWLPWLVYFLYDPVDQKVDRGYPPQRGRRQTHSVQMAARSLSTHDRRTEV